MATTAARPKRPRPPATRRPRQPPAPHNRPPHLAREKPHTKEGEKERERGSGGHDRRCVPCCCLKEEREEKQAHPYRNKREREREREKGKQRETRTREGEEEREVLVVLPVQVLQPTPLIEVPRRGPAGTPTDTSKRVSDGEGEERQGRSHFLSLCLSLPDMHAQTRTARRQRQTRHTEGPEAQHGGRRTKRETHTRKAGNTHTHTDTHSRKQRTHRYPEALRAR